MAPALAPRARGRWLPGPLARLQASGRGHGRGCGCRCGCGCGTGCGCGCGTGCGCHFGALPVQAGLPRVARRRSAPLSAGAPRQLALHAGRGFGTKAPEADSNVAPASVDEVQVLEEEFIDSRVPVTIITGFLGSGKTTLLNRVLTSGAEERKGVRIAVVENEFGEIGIDQELVAFQENLEGEDIMLLNNGCMCCTVREDLVRLLNHLSSDKRGSFDHILVETTGVAHPMPIIGTFFTEESVAEEFRLEGVVTLVDAKHASGHIDKVARGDENASAEVVEQIAYADRIVLNKTDLVTPSELEGVRQRVTQINALAEVQESERCAGVDCGQVLELGGFDLDRIESELEELASSSHHHHHHHEHDHSHGDEHSHDHEHSSDGHGHGGDEHSGLGSVSVRFQGEFDLDKVNEWMAFFLGSRSEDVYRMKGILAIRGWDEKFVFQGVHSQFEGMASKLWAEGEQRGSKVVLIGRGLDRAEIESGLRDCLCN